MDEVEGSLLCIGGFLCGGVLRCQSRPLFDLFGVSGGFNEPLIDCVIGDALADNGREEANLLHTVNSC